MSKKAIRELGAITIIQPWAEVILKHGKNVENRKKNSHFRGVVLLHASSKNSAEWFEDCSIKIKRDSVPFGAVVGFANLTDVITKKQVTPRTRKWFQGKFGYVLENRTTLKNPIPMLGKRGLWTIKGKELQSFLKKLSPSDLRTLRKLVK